MSNGKKALYSQIVDCLKEKIDNNELLPGDRLPTELELAESFGVSRITSKRALVELEREKLICRKRGQGSFVLPKSDKSSYVMMNKVISLILPSDGSGRRIDYIKGATDFLNSKGYYLSIHTTNDDLKKERDLLINLPKNGISGIIYYPWLRKNFDVLYSMYLNNYPVVVIDKRFQSLPLSYVISDNFDGGYQATSHLINLGHECIAYIAEDSPEEISTVRERLFGYCKALSDHKIPINHDVIKLSLLYDKTKSLKEILQDLVEKGVTGIFAEHDYMGLLIARTLQEMDIKVPDEISLIGFDNLGIHENIDFKLTSIDQNFYEIGKIAAEMIMDNIENSFCKYGERVVPVNLILRETSVEKNDVEYRTSK